MRQIKCKLPHASGLLVDGPSGTRYRVDPATRVLHVYSGEGHVGAPGVNDEDAAEFLSFTDVYVASEAKAVPPPPPRPAAGEPATEVPSVPDLKEQEVEPTPAAASKLDSLPPLPSDMGTMEEVDWSPVVALMQTKEWLAESARIGLALSLDEKQIKPKAKLVKLIYQRASESPVEG